MEQTKKILKHINQNIIDGNVINMYLILLEGKMVLLILIVLCVIATIISLVLELKYREKVMSYFPISGFNRVKLLMIRHRFSKSI